VALLLIGIGVWPCLRRGAAATRGKPLPVWRDPACVIAAAALCLLAFGIGIAAAAGFTISGEVEALLLLGVPGYWLPLFALPWLALLLIVWSATLQVHSTGGADGAATALSTAFAAAAVVALALTGLLMPTLI
jgi:hypothetical protein